MTTVRESREREERRRARKGKRLQKIKNAVSNIGTLNIILICVGAFFLYFNFQMLQLYKEFGSLPETYAVAVVGATIGECGICGWIRTNKDRHQERKWQKEDEEQYKEEQERSKKDE